MNVNSGELVINRWKKKKNKNTEPKMMFKKKKNHITTYPETYEVSPNLFLLLGCLWGKLQFFLVWRIKGARSVNAQRSRPWAYL